MKLDYIERVDAALVGCGCDEQSDIDLLDLQARLHFHVAQIQAELNRRIAKVPRYIADED